MSPALVCVGFGGGRLTEASVQVSSAAAGAPATTGKAAKGAEAEPSLTFILKPSLM